MVDSNDTYVYLSWQWPLSLDLGIPRSVKHIVENFLWLSIVLNLGPETRPIINSLKFVSWHFLQ